MIGGWLRRAARRDVPQPDRERLVREVERLRARADRQEARAAELAVTVERSRERMAELTRRLDERRRATLSPDVLRLVLAARARQPPIDSETAMAAAAREARFLAGSEAYARLVEDEPARTAALQQISDDGIPWWLPVDSRPPGKAIGATRPSFPYRVILQTREVGVGGVMLDLGASVGRTSVTRGLLGDVRAVYAAEPEPASYTALVQNVVAHGLRGIVLPDRVAVGAARGEVQLHQSRFLDGHRVLATPVTGAGHHVVQVACWPVDAWMPQVGCDPRAVTFVKVDVQGGEPEVLRGAGGLLARRQAAWQVAIAPALLAKAGRSMADLLGALEPHFTHFIDIGTPPAGRTRLQPAAGLADWLTYLGSGQPATDLLLLP